MIICFRPLGQGQFLKDLSRSFKICTQAIEPLDNNFNENYKFKTSILAQAFCHDNSAINRSAASEATTVNIYSLWDFYDFISQGSAK